MLTLKNVDVIRRALRASPLGLVAQFGNQMIKEPMASGQDKFLKQAFLLGLIAYLPFKVDDHVTRHPFCLACGHILNLAFSTIF